MIHWNYPAEVLFKLRSGDIWKTSVINFIVLNVIYFSHNLIENQSSKFLEKTIFDQMFLLLYYFLAIILISAILKAFKLNFSMSAVTQYLLSTSIIFCIIYIVDIPILFFGYNLDIFFRLLEFSFYLWISWILVGSLTMSKKKYVIIAAIMCVFYLTIIVCAIILGSSSIIRNVV